MVTPDLIGHIRQVRERVAENMFGLDNVTGLLLTALVAGGHVLLEGNPGLGKTMLARRLGKALGFTDGRVGRIQFTPDLMPSDITGTLMPAPGDKGVALEFSPGPIFNWLLIADEINRATPKTQAAMLEAMAERQVTVLGKTYPLAERGRYRFRESDVQTTPPFLVMATQNPIDQEGTYELPEAQSDRFMFKARMPFPGFDVLDRIVQKDADIPDAQSARDQPSDDQQEQEAVAAIGLLRRGIRASSVPEHIRCHILNMVLASNRIEETGMRLVPKRHQRVRTFVDRYLEFPLGPRAATALILGVKGWSMIMLTDQSSPDIAGEARDALAQLTAPTLRHRLKLKFGWRRTFEEDYPKLVHLTDEDARDRVATEFATLCTPGDDGNVDAMREAYETAMADPF